MGQVGRRKPRRAGAVGYPYALVEVLDIWKNWAIIVAGIVGLTTFLNGVLEYVRQGKQHRAENFVRMRRRFLETPQYREILDLLATEDPKLRELSIQEKRNFVGFLEEVALMVNSRLIRREVAHYMFGYYVLLTAKSQNFWENLDREGVYWSVFRAFAEDMAKISATNQNYSELHF